MNRRNFFAAIGAVGTVSMLASREFPQAQTRYVMFNPPKSETCAIYWMSGHRPVDEFVEMYREHLAACASMQPSQVKHGWASRKMDLGGVYLSDRPLENFEPITYWIPTDQEVT